jgi:hypothetical protein
LFGRGFHRKKDTATKHAEDTTQHSTTTYKSKNVPELVSQDDDESVESQASSFSSCENFFRHRKNVYNRAQYPTPRVHPTEHWCESHKNYQAPIHIEWILRYVEMKTVRSQSSFQNVSQHDIC